MSDQPPKGATMNELMKWVAEPYTRAVHAEMDRIGRWAGELLAHAEAQKFIEAAPLWAPEFPTGLHVANYGRWLILARAVRHGLGEAQRAR